MRSPGLAYWPNFHINYESCRKQRTIIGVAFVEGRFLHRKKNVGHFIYMMICKDERLDHVTGLLCVPWKLLLSRCELNAISNIPRMFLYNVK
jgi:hypothetical protein